MTYLLLVMHAGFLFSLLAAIRRKWSRFETEIYRADLIIGSLLSILVTFVAMHGEDGPAHAAAALGWWL